MCVSVRKYCLWPLTVSVMEYIINSAESLNISFGRYVLLYNDNVCGPGMSSEFYERVFDFLFYIIKAIGYLAYYNKSVREWLLTIRYD